jgi:RNA polymerase sigma-70 factor, ECF subfamily
MDFVKPIMEHTGSVQRTCQAMPDIQGHLFAPYRDRAYRIHPIGFGSSKFGKAKKSWILRKTMAYHGNNLTKGEDLNLNEQFTALLMKHLPDVTAFISALVRDPHTCDDMVQDVTLALWKYFDRYDSTRPFGPWARGIAWNIVLKSWEKSKRRPVIFPPEAVEAVMNAYDRTERADDASEHEALRSCLDKLPMKSRSLLAARYERQEEIGKLAEVMNSTAMAVSQSLHRIRTGLRNCIRRRIEALERGA